MNKLNAAIAIFVGFNAYAASAAEVDFYGKANLSVQSSDDGEGSFTEVKSNASRIGVKGSEKLEGDQGLEVVYKAEFQVDYSDESGAENIKARNQYVGLRGGFGEILVGRNDTQLKQSQGKIDLFNDYEADLKRLWKGENRAGDSVTYVTPSLSGFKLGVTAIAEDTDEEEAKNSASVALTYGDSKLKKTNFYAALAGDSEVNGYDTARVSAAVKLGGVRLGAIYHSQETVDSGVEETGFLVSGAYTIDALTFKAQHQTIEDAAFTSLGVDYSLAKSTTVFAWYSDSMMTDEETLEPVTDKQSYLAFGLEHKF